MAMVTNNLAYNSGSQRHLETETQGDRKPFPFDMDYKDLKTEEAGPHSPYVRCSFRDNLKVFYEALNIIYESSFSNRTSELSRDEVNEGNLIDLRDDVGMSPKRSEGRTVTPLISANVKKL